MTKKMRKEINGHPTKYYILKRKQQAITLAPKSAVKIDNEYVQVDPQLLFQCVILFLQTDRNDLEVLFQYELCSYSPDLFDQSLFMR